MAAGLVGKMRVRPDGISMPFGVFWPSWTLALVEVEVGGCQFGPDLSWLDSKGIKEKLGSGLVAGDWGLRVGHTALGVWIWFQIEDGLGGWPLTGASGGFLRWQVMGLFDPNLGWLGWRPCSNLGWMVVGVVEMIRR